MPTQDTILPEYPQELVDKVVRAKCYKSVLFQTRYLFKAEQNRRFIVGEHHRIIDEVLEKVFSGEITRLIINLPPRYGKTELAVKNFIAKGLWLNPASKFIHISYSDDLALDNSESIRDLVNSESYQRLFPHVIPKKDAKAKKKWYTTAGGGVYATSSGGQITGFGAGKVDEEEETLSNEIEGLERSYGNADKFKFAGAIVIDDPNKPDDAESPAMRGKVNDRWDNTISSRTNSRKTPIIVIQQRIHPLDLTGYLLSKEGAENEWYVLTLPAIQEYKDETGAIQHKALWPHKHTLEELRSMEKSNPLVFARQYQQEESASQGLLFPLSELQFYDPADFDPLKGREYGFACVDPSDTGGDDLSAPFTVLNSGKVFIHDVLYNTNGVEYNESEIVTKALQYKPNALWIEGNGGWSLFGKGIRKKLHEVHSLYDCDIRLINSSTHKHTRIMDASGWIKRNCVFRSDWRDIPQYKKFMNVLTQYQIIQEKTNAKDDAPDSLAMVRRHLNTQGLMQ